MGEEDGREQISRVRLQSSEPSARTRFLCLATCAEMVIRDFGHLSLSMVLNPEAVERVPEIFFSADFLKCE